MRSSIKRLGLGAVAVCVALGVGASAAGATSWTPASPGTLALEGNLTIRNSGYSAPNNVINCNNIHLLADAYTDVNAGMDSHTGWYQSFSCVNAGTGASGRFALYPGGEAVHGGSSFALILAQISLSYPTMFGGFMQAMGVGGQTSIPWTNGAGTTPSKITLNNTRIGGLNYATGTLTVKQSSGGGLVTLNP